MTNKTPNKTKTPVGGLILGSDPIELMRDAKPSPSKSVTPATAPFRSAPIFISSK